MIISIGVCLLAFFALLLVVRRDQVSLGLPVAYLFALLIIHVPGAIAHAVGSDILVDTKYTELGIGFTAVGAVSFVVGVAIARYLVPGRLVYAAANHLIIDRRHFWVFCLVAGWMFTYALTPLRAIPSLGAAIEKAGAVWMLGVLLGLRAAVSERRARSIGMWLAALAVYPVLMLLLGGFLSYGSTAIMIVVSVLAVSARSHRRVLVGAAIAAVFGFHVFLSYFQHRDEIRDAVWGGASMQQRIDRTISMVSDFGVFDPSNEAHLNSLDQRLNQNYFAGLSASRIADGQADYLYGRSVWEGLISLVPRALWPEKPVFAGSPKIVVEMTGLMLSDNASWGVGNVMEFQINFGIPGVIGGFVLLGLLIGALDRKAAIAERDGDLGRIFIYFLPAVALIQPNGSIVELVSGSVASLLAAYGWKWGWRQWTEFGTRPTIAARSHGDGRR